MGRQQRIKLFILLVLIVSSERPGETAKDNISARKENKIISDNNGDNIIYDVSSVIRETKKTGSIDKILDEYPSEYKVSKLYYEIDENIGNKTCFYAAYTGWNKSVRCDYSGIIGISIVLNEKAGISPVRNFSITDISSFKIRDVLPINTSFIEFVVTSFQNNHLSCYFMILRLTHYMQYQLYFFEFKQNETVKFGLEYTESFMEQCESVPFNFLHYEFSILKIELTPLSTMLSYGFFCKLMDNLVARNGLFIGKKCSHCTVHIRLVIKNSEAIISENHFERYEALIAKFFSAWYMQSSGKEIYIVNIFQNVTVSENRYFLKTNVSARYSDFENNLFDCNHHKILKQVQLLFNKVLLLVKFHEIGDLCQLTNENCLNAALVRNGSVDLWLYDFLSDSDKTLEWLTGILCNHQINPKLDMIYFHFDKIPNSNETAKVHNITAALNKRFGKKIQMGGTFNVFIDTTQGNFSCFDKVKIDYICHHWSKLAKILVYCDIMTANKEHLLIVLRDFHDNMQLYENNCSGKTFVPLINIVNVEKRNVASIFEFLTPLYCNADVELLNELYQTVFSFANIHKWKEIVIDQVLQQEGFAWWKYVDLRPDINQSQTGFPLFLRTNAEMSADEDLPMTYPCIQRVQHADSLGIQFKANKHSGVTIDIGLRSGYTSLTGAELKIALLFALEKFSVVQLIARNAAEFRQATSVLTQSSLNTIKSSRQHLSFDKPLVFIDVPLKQVLNYSDSIVNGVLSNSVGLLVSEWEDEYPYTNHEDHEMFSVQLGSHSYVNFGITIQKCSHEINLQLKRIKSLPYFKMLSYIVCNITLTTWEIYHNDFIHKLAEPLFYIKSYMEATLNVDNGAEGKKVEVMFQLNFEAEKCSNLYNIETFLKQMDEINQHSSAYQIGYFIGRAFDKEHSAVENCAFSWWRVQNYSDLANVSAYVDREEEFFGRPTILTTKENENKSDVVKHDAIPLFNYVLIITLVVVVTLLFLFFTLWFQSRRAENAFLTQKETGQFYNGEDQDGMMMMMTNSMDCPDTIYMKFEACYEISLRNIELGMKIGSGEFGVVCKGVLADRGEVAVKIPRSDSGKDHFKSALSELKILCYIGHHTNIVSFLGAHTKQIGNGKLYIVTEYCERGSLQGYLRELKAEQVSNTESKVVPSVVDLGQLCVFSVQIASGMEYVAEKRVVHADLATRNVLLTSELTCKVADFGLSRKLYELDQYVKTSKEPLPWRWMAPECLRNMEFTTKSDVWSYGVTVWEIFSLGMVPYTGRSWSRDFVTELENGLRIQKAEHASNEIHQKLMDSWKASPDERPTFTDLKQFFAELRSQEYLLNE